MTVTKEMQEYLITALVIPGRPLKKEPDVILFRYSAGFRF